MKHLLAVINPLIVMFAFHGLQAQTSSVPQMQQPNAPCTVSARSSAIPANGSAPKLSDDAKKKLKQKMDWVQKYIPLQLPDPTVQADKLKPILPPCPPTLPNLQTAPVVKLPPDTSVTFHCNPLSPSPKDASGHQTLTLPDPHDFAVPKAGDFEADSVVPDLAAKTPCYLIKVDPKTQKSFIQQ